MARRWTAGCSIDCRSPEHERIVRWRHLGRKGDCHWSDCQGRQDTSEDGRGGCEEWFFNMVILLA